MTDPKAKSDCSPASWFGATLQVTNKAVDFAEDSRNDAAIAYAQRRITSLQFSQVEIAVMQVRLIASAGIGPQA